MFFVSMPKVRKKISSAAFLDEFGIRSTGPSSDLSRSSFEDVLARVQEQGGISISAHITVENGLFDVLSGTIPNQSMAQQGSYGHPDPGSSGEPAKALSARR